jgi:hypothetical protein
MTVTNTEHSPKAPHSTGIFAVLCGLRSSQGTGMPKTSRNVLAVLVALGIFALTATPVLAGSVHVFSRSFGGKGSAAGRMELASDSGVAVNATTHDVYVADTGNHRIDEFEADGTFLRAWGWGVGGIPGFGECTLLTSCDAGESGSAPGEFEAPAFIAVDNSTEPGDTSKGDLYVSDTGTGLVQKFTAEGALVRSWGVEGQLGTVPITVATGTGDLTAGSTVITGLKVTNGKFNQNQKVLGEGIPASASFEAGGPEHLRLTEPATETKTGVVLTAQRQLGAGTIVVNATGDLLTFTSSAVLEFSQSGDFVAELYVEGDAPLPSRDLAVRIPYSASELAEYTAVQRAEIDDGNYLEREGPVYLTGSTANIYLKGGPSGAITGLAFDQATGKLYVDQTGTSIEEISSTGSVIEVFGAPGLSGGAGLGVDSSVGSPTSSTVYAANISVDQVDVFGVAMEVNSGSISEVKATGATLNGEVNPEGDPVRECRFEYGTNAEYEFTVPCEHPDAAEIGEGVSPVAVHAKITGLRGSTAYHFRLVAEHENVVTHETKAVAGEDKEFPTSPVPVIASAEAVGVTAGGAELRATVNPEGLQVSRCVFEYGTSRSYGASVRCAQKKATVGAGTEPVPVSAQLSGLAPNTTYYWRLSVEDVDGEGYESGHAFVYPTTGAGLPDNRTYEMVTPSFKGGGLIGDVFFGFSPAVSEGPEGIHNGPSRVIALTIQCFAPSESCAANRPTNGEPFEFTRTGEGWETTALAPPASQFSENTPWLVSANEGTALFSMPSGPTTGDEWYARSPEGSFLPIGPATPPGVTSIDPFKLSAQKSTADLSHVVWDPSNAFWPFDQTAGEGPSLYEYVGTHNPEPFLVGVTGGRDSTELISTCGTILGSEGHGTQISNWGALSGDGRTVYYTAGACSGGTGANAGRDVPVNELYARVDGGESGAHTVAISEPQALAATEREECESTECRRNTSVAEQSEWRNATFWGASADGSKVFFTSEQQLTDKAIQGSNNLYLYDPDQPSGHNLIDVSSPESNGENPQVQGTVAISADGSHVYFVAQGVLTATPNGQRQSARSGRDNLYVYAEGRTTFIASLPASDATSDWSTAHRPNVTPDGRFLVFESSGDLTPDDARADETQQVFRYDAASKELVRISIGADGFDDSGNAGTGNASIVPAFIGEEDAGSPRGDPTMSNDGSYIFFQSPIGLTPHALNDVVIHSQDFITEYAQNVYEWHEGHVYLISDGRDTSIAHTPCAARVDTTTEIFTSAVCLLGSDATGQNVFFMTADQLVPKDTDTQVDIYDARICEPDNGNPCISEPSAPLPACGGEACHGIPAATPSLLAPGTASFNGEGNLSSPSPARVVVKKKVAKCPKGKTHNKQGKCVKQKKARKAKQSAKRAGNDRRTRR